MGIELELFPVEEAGGWGRPAPLAVVQAAVERLGPLPCGSSVTFEPGGQLELSTPASPDASTATRALTADLAAITRALSSAGVRLVASGTDPVRLPHRLVDGPRYRAMEAYFDAVSAEGRTMMCSTAALQVNIGLGPPAARARRWALAHAAGPALVASFANSPFLAGRTSGFKSARMATWLALDPTRTAPAAGGYDTFALGARVMLMRI